MKKYWILLILLVLFLVFGFLGWGIYLPKDFASTETKTFLIKKGEGITTILSNLEKEGLIKSGLFFGIYTIARGVAGRLQAGEYSLSPSMNIPEITKKFVTGDVTSKKITIIEGWTLMDIGEYLEKNGIISKAKDFYGLNSPLWRIDFSQEFDFLKDKPEDSGLQGYLLPDTYEIGWGISPEEIIRKMLGNFDKKLTPDLRKEIKRQGKTIFEIVTVASLLEKEVKEKEVKELVSGILWKRLENGIPLQVDATITYIKKTTNPQGVASRPYGARISIEETQIDSPYNTYKYKGLPLGPISNPGLESIISAIYPENSEYWYYLSTQEGETIFSKTLEEHNIAKAKYLK